MFNFRTHFGYTICTLGRMAHTSLSLETVDSQSIQLAALINIGALAVSISDRSADIVPISVTASMASVQDSSGDTRIYFQASDNSITELAVSGPFSSVHTNNAPGFTLVPANQVISGSAVAAFETTGGDVRVFLEMITHQLNSP